MNNCKLIAEIGWNHIGDMDLAKRMIYSAKSSGADYAKFQTWKVSRLKPGPWDTDGRREIYEKAELSEDNHYELKEYCDSVGIKFLTSLFSEHDVDFVSSICDEVKIPSSECTNAVLVNKCIDSFSSIYLSTGASCMEEYLPYLSNNKVTVLHCVSSYPCEYENINFEKFIKLKERSNRVGYSGHLQGIWDAIVAIMHGAVVVEKHFTIDHELPGRDNKFALLPGEFSQIRDFEDNFRKMLYNYSGMNIQECEENYRKYQMGRWNNEQ